jgi:Asp-tRNA(Asn)/Glu-tRNA(Gln) amidotransferase A subunit family amidase
MLWLLPTVEKFPRSQKFLLGGRMQSAALDIIEGLVEATYTRNRMPVLRTVNLKPEQLDDRARRGLRGVVAHPARRLQRAPAQPADTGRLGLGVDYVQAVRRRRELRAELQHAMAGLDVVLTATQPAEAAKIDAVPKWDLFDKPGFMMPFNVAGYPAISVCAGFGAG